MPPRKWEMTVARQDYIMDIFDKIDDKFDKIDANFDKLNDKLDNKLGEINKNFDKIPTIELMQLIISDASKSIKLWMLFLIYLSLPSFIYAMVQLIRLAR